MPTTGDIVGTEKKLEENKMFKKLKDKKGFTLVELIVVLVILAILAALLVPALTGYIDKAKEQSIIAETRQVVVAAQTLGDEAYAKKDIGTAITFGTGKDVTFDDVATLAEVSPATNIKSIEWADGKISHVQYEKGGKTCDYWATAFTDATTPANSHEAGYTVK